MRFKDKITYQNKTKQNIRSQTQDLGFERFAWAAVCGKSEIKKKFSRISSDANHPFKWFQITKPISSDEYWFFFFKIIYKNLGFGKYVGKIFKQ